jgi:hypothetical protein
MPPRFKAASAAFLAALLFSAAPGTIARPAQSPAMELVQRQNLGSNLKTIALATAQQTETYAMLASKVGAARAKTLVTKELDSHAREFGGKWNQNLADIYTRHFSADELASLAKDGKKSQYAGKMVEQQGAIGGEMRRASTPILIAYVTASMKSALSRAAAK